MIVTLWKASSCKELLKFIVNYGVKNVLDFNDNMLGKFRELVKDGTIPPGKFKMHGKFSREACTEKELDTFLTWMYILEEPLAIHGYTAIENKIKFTYISYKFTYGVFDGYQVEMKRFWNTMSKKKCMFIYMGHVAAWHEKDTTMVYFDLLPRYAKPYYNDYIFEMWDKDQHDKALIKMVGSGGTLEHGPGKLYPEDFIGR
jgi:hypothetical protein